MAPPLGPPRASDALARARARLGINYLVTRARLPGLEARVLELVALGCRDVLLVAYNGRDPRKNETDDERSARRMQWIRTMPAPSRKSTGWRSIPPCEFWVCPACLIGSDPDEWQIQHDIVHCPLSPSYQRAVCSLWCPRCSADFGSGSGAAEIARLTEARIEARRNHVPLRQRLSAAWQRHRPHVPPRRGREGHLG